MWHGHRSLRFVVVGGSIALLYFVTCFAAGYFLGWNAFWSSAVAYAIGLSIGYATHRKVTFRSNAEHGSALRRYFTLHVTGLVLTSSTMAAAAELSNLEPLGVSLASTALCGIISYFISSRWVFRSVNDYT
jgi:putative flippase GtrA